ncbi:MAG: hypothetical protein HWD59_03615 [Coxiellaceae bacterium]|nr:MAG: hypothetical protein HWD59_03615 [Coxiellaceae bacterium]
MIKKSCPISQIFASVDKNVPSARPAQYNGSKPVSISYSQNNASVDIHFSDEAWHKIVYDRMKTTLDASDNIYEYLALDSSNDVITAKLKSPYRNFGIKIQDFIGIFSMKKTNTKCQNCRD